LIAKSIMGANTQNGTGSEENGNSSGGSDGTNAAKQGISGSNSYNSTHQKNYEIASGKGYMGQ
jgi:hypothetical protein